MPKRHPVHEVNNDKYRNPNVSSQKARRRPVAGEEDRETIQQTQQCEHYQRNVSSIRLHEQLPRYLNVLRPRRLQKTEIHYAATDPTNESRCVGQVNETS